MINNEVVGFIKESFDLKEQGYYKQAIEMLYKALAIDYDNVEILSQLAELYYLLENNQRAIDYIEKALDIKPKHLVALELLKKIQIQEKKYDEALNTVDKIFEIAPTQVLLAEKIRILNLLNNIEGVKALLSFEGFEFEDVVLFEFANMYYNEKNFDKAIEFLEKARLKNSKNVNVLSLLGQIYFETSRVEKAKDLFLKLEEIEPSAKVMNYLGLYYLDNLKLSDAIKYFDLAFKKDSKNSGYAFNLANAYFLNGWMAEAVKVFNLAICLDENNCEYHYALAYLYFKEEKYDNSLKEIKTIFEIDSEYLQAKILKALITFKKGNSLLARVELEKLFVDNQDDEFLLSSLATVYKDLDLNEKLEALRKKLVELKPNSVGVLVEYVESLILNDKFDEAKSIANGILEQNANYIDAHILLAKIYEKLEDFENLFKVAQEIINLDANRFEGYYFNAMALFAQKDIQFAIETMKKAISLDVANAMLYVQMSEFYQALGEYENALEYIKEAGSIDKSSKNRELYMKLASIVRKSKINSL